MVSAAGTVLSAKVNGMELNPTAAPPKITIDNNDMPNSL